MDNFKIKKLEKTFDKITFVTMCFNLGMEKLSVVKSEKRVSYYEYYVKSLIKLCNTFDNIVIFCDHECEKLLEEHKNEISNKYITRVIELNELEKWKHVNIYCKNYLEMEREIQRRKKLRYPRFLQEGSIVKCGYPKENAIYTVLNNSKIDLLCLAAIDNPYDSNYFYWIDCGCFASKYSLFWENWDGEFNYVPQNIIFSFHLPTMNDVIERALGLKLSLPEPNQQKWFEFRKCFVYNMKNTAFGFLDDQMVASIFGGDRLKTQ